MDVVGASRPSDKSLGYSRSSRWDAYGVANVSMMNRWAIGNSPGGTCFCLVASDSCAGLWTSCDARDRFKSTQPRAAGLQVPTWPPGAGCACSTPALGGGFYAGPSESLDTILADGLTHPEQARAVAREPPWKAADSPPNADRTPVRDCDTVVVDRVLWLLYHSFGFACGDAGPARPGR